MLPRPSCPRKPRANADQPAATFDTPKPEALLERLIAAATQPGDRILDCFAGSRTTLAVAQKKTGRVWTGVELSPETIRDFIQPRIDRILAGSDPLPLEGYTTSTQAYSVSSPEYAAAA